MLRPLPRSRTVLLAPMLSLCFSCQPRGIVDSGHDDIDEVVGSEATLAELIAFTKTCDPVLSKHTYRTDSGKQVSICGLEGAIHFTADMDIDCDGRPSAECNEKTDCCFQPQTAFTNKQGQPLSAARTPYLVIPNDFHVAGLQGGAVGAIIYKGKIQYAVFGDTGPSDIIGEASYAAARNLGINPDARNGGTQDPVTYVVFLGKDAVPDDLEDQDEVNEIGERLTARMTGRPGGKCQPESDATFCTRLVKDCGAVTGNDNCGKGRTVACGECAGAERCGGGGAPNVCGTGGDPIPPPEPAPAPGKDRTICLNADGPGGQETYARIESVFGRGAVENRSDTAHSPPFRHVKEETDDEVGPHFIVFSHRDLDNDGSPDDDRMRTEFKVNTGADAAIKGTPGETLTYTWRFKMNAQMGFSNRFTHMFQMKSFGGNAGAPIVTITGSGQGSGERLRVEYWGDSADGVDGRRIAAVPMAGLKGIWLSVQVRAQIAQSGSLAVTIKKPDGSTVINASASGLDLWRQGDYVRGKWGIYRGKSDQLRAQEETVRFANFGITAGSNPSSDCHTR